MRAATASAMRVKSLSFNPTELPSGSTGRAATVALTRAATESASEAICSAVRSGGAAFFSASDGVTLAAMTAAMAANCSSLSLAATGSLAAWTRLSTASTMADKSSSVKPVTAAAAAAG